MQVVLLAASARAAVCQIASMLGQPIKIETVKDQMSLQEKTKTKGRQERRRDDEEA